MNDTPILLREEEERRSGRKDRNVLHRVMYPKMHANGFQKKKKDTPILFPRLIDPNALLVVSSMNAPKPPPIVTLSLKHKVRSPSPSRRTPTEEKWRQQLRWGHSTHRVGIEESLRRAKQRWGSKLATLCSQSALICGFGVPVRKRSALTSASHRNRVRP